MCRNDAELRPGCRSPERLHRYKAHPQNAAVATTTGLLRTLNRGEITGVMAHDLAHIANRDTLNMTITAPIAGALSMLANFAMFFGGGSRRAQHSPGGLGILGVLALMVLAPLAAGMARNIGDRRPTPRKQPGKTRVEGCGSH